MRVLSMFQSMFHAIGLFFMLAVMSMLFSGGDEQKANRGLVNSALVMVMCIGLDIRRDIKELKDDSTPCP